MGRGVVASELLVRRQAERRCVVKKRYFRASVRMILHNPVDNDQKLIAISRAREEIVGCFLWIAEHVRIGRRHERYLIVGDAAAECFRVSRAPAHESHDAFADELAVELLGAVDPITVILVQQLERAAVDAAFAVDPADIVTDAVGIARPHIRSGPGEREDGADEDGIVLLRASATSARHAKRER